MNQNLKLILFLQLSCLISNTILNDLINVDTQQLLYNIHKIP